MKRKRLFPAFFMVLALAPGWALAQAATEVSNLSISPSIICGGSSVTVNYEAAAPGNNTNNETLYTMAAFGTANDGVFDAADLPFISSASPNGFPATQSFSYYSGPPLYTAIVWASFNPTFTNLVPYTAITTAPTGFANGTVIYLKVGASTSYSSGTGSPSSFLSIPVTISCTESDAINTGMTSFVSGGVTYTGASSPVTLLIEQCTSPTSTPTAIPTSTQTRTPTSTPTFQFSPTVTNTPTITYTPTVTDTPTVTGTWTSTGTPTHTPTITNSFTATSTATITDSFTITATATNSFTPTNTATITNTFPFSPTATPTPTATATWSATNTTTLTSTVTSTPGVIMAKVGSESTAEGGDTLTYTIGITVIGNALNGVVVTDILPSGVAFVDFGTSPSGTLDNYNANNSQLQWILPSPLNPGAYQLTYQTKVNTSITGGTMINNQAVMSYNGGAPVTSVFKVQVLGVYTVSVNVYNSAGELVKQISVQEMSSPVNDITLSTNQITALTGIGSSVNIYYGEYSLGSWNGMTSSGNPVSNGTYYLKVDSISPLDTVTSVIQPITVDRNYSQLTVNIYNSAGELVKHLYALEANPQGVEMTAVGLSSPVIKPGGAPGSQPSDIQIVVGSNNGSSVTLTWDGTGDNGSLVAPGVYELEAQWSDGEGGTTDIIKEILVQPGMENNGTIVAEPNVLNQKNGTFITFLLNSSQVASMKFKIYTIAGELVPSHAKQSSTTWVSYDASSLASGLYLAEVEAFNSSNQLLQHQILKFTVTH